eukprot:TRINITY_DN13043_c0_g1_i1.p1 TRINITY_DN13043_c0_g1~~TRINITY_DN13043_c0_g1_i1.p1  ORF type:complete len:161 (-),score=47.88 TRINITY_DN13043_c0_g1_i1:41-523(-)
MVEVDDDFNMTKNAEVYTVRGDKGAPTIYNTMLTEVNVKHGTYGKNNFYKMQVIRDTVKDMFILWTRWGRVGDDGQHQQTPYPSAKEATAEFDKIFKSKTGNSFCGDIEDSFKKIPGKYRLVRRVDETSKKPKDLLEPFPKVLKDIEKKGDIYSALPPDI